MTAADVLVASASRKFMPDCYCLSQGSNRQNIVDSMLVNKIRNLDRQRRIPYCQDKADKIDRSLDPEADC